MESAKEHRTFHSGEVQGRITQTRETNFIRTLGLTAQHKTGEARAIITKIDRDHANKAVARNVEDIKYNDKILHPYMNQHFDSVVARSVEDILVAKYKRNLRRPVLYERIRESIQVPLDTTKDPGTLVSRKSSGPSRP